jgi:hypothetical protein
LRMFHGGFAQSCQIQKVAVEEGRGFTKETIARL